MNTPLWSSEDVRAHLSGASGTSPAAYAMYSSQYGAVVTDPTCMSVPVDDHLVHRGDGVFETLLLEQGAVYNLQAHLNRLETSAAFIGLELPESMSSITERILDTFSVAGQTRALARVLAGRGPGGFSVDPAASPKGSLYVVVYPAPLPFMEREPEGARAILSRMPPKPGGLAGVKTCNYLPNALMKAEATRAGAHFALGVDTDGFLTESFTENLAGIDRTGRLVIPPAPHHLSGTTLARVAELATASGREVAEHPLRPEELFDLAEVLLCGTTAYVSCVVELDGRALPTGTVWRELSELLREDIRTNPDLRTPVPGE